jgi:hypothetical protein
MAVNGQRLRMSACADLQIAAEALPLSASL